VEVVWGAVMTLHGRACDDERLAGRRAFHAGMRAQIKLVAQGYRGQGDEGGAGAQASGIGGALAVRHQPVWLGT
jgi:hypothetical protein